MFKKLIGFLLVVVFVFSVGINAFAATIGQQLLEPEAGWQRFDDTNNYIKIPDAYPTIYHSMYYNGSTAQIKANGTVEFKFRGTKFRIIGGTYSDMASVVSVTIDGIGSGSYSTCSSQSAQKLLFEKLNLQDTEHIVILHAVDNRTELDAIDIDDTGFLLDANPPANPTNLIAAAGNGQVNLIWTATTGSTITYNVKRSTVDDGSYETIATTSETAYTDNNVINGTTYYYVVSAEDTNGESENSNEVSATPAAPPVTEGNKAILEITLDNGIEKEYDLTAAELQDFLTWYDDRSEGTGKAYFVFTKKANINPFLSRKEYIAFDKIQSFEVKEYED